jgi:glycosyltransferase involved in cell wall biosynthesis
MAVQAQRIALTQRPNLVLIGSRDLFEPGIPTVCALMTRATWLCRFYQVHLVSLATKAAPVGAPAPFASLTLVPPASLLRLVINCTRARIAGQPMQERFNSNRVARGRVGQLLDRLMPEVIMLDTFRALAFLPERWRGRGTQILDLHDLLSARYRRFLESRTRDNFYGKALELHSARWSALANRLAGPILRHEARALAWREAAAPAQFRAVTLCSPQEAEALRQRTGAGNIHAVRQMLAELDLTQPATPADFTAHRAYFVGIHRYPPNLAAVHLLLDELLPEIVRNYPDFVLHIVGGGIPPELARAHAANPSVRFDGFVADLKKHLQAIPLLIAPFVSGSGIKTKVVEAMAWGKAVVSNAIGFEGLEPRPDHEAFLATDSASFVNATLRALAHPKHTAAIATRGCSMVREMYDCERLLEQWHDLIEMARRSPQAQP